MNSLRSGLRIAIIVLYGLIEFGFYMGLIGSLQTNEASWETISESSKACKAYGKILPWFKYIHKPQIILHLPRKFSLHAWVEGQRVVGIIVGFCLAGISALLLIRAFIYWAYTIRAFMLSQRAVLSGLMSLAFTIGVLVEVVQMERTRNDMKSVTGAAFQDNQWGFAQVISLFLWIPLCIQSVYYGIRFVFPTRTTRPADPESAETVRVNIRDVPNSLHLRYPALNYPQYEERLRTHEIRELADVSKFDATFYNSKVGMDYGAAYLFCKWAADSEKRLKSWGDNLEEKTGAQGEPGDAYE